MDSNNKDIEMATKLTSCIDTRLVRRKDDAVDRPPTPPKRDYKAEDNSGNVTEPEVKRVTRLFPRPEVIYKPENTKIYMTCLKNLLILFNLIIWLLGAVLTGIGIWTKFDESFWEIQTGLDMKQFSYAGTMLIVVGVIIMLIGFVGCYGAISLSLCMLIVYAIVVILILLLEIAAMALVFTAINNKDAREDIKSKAKKAMQEMAQDPHQQHFVNILQSKLKCCGIDGPDDYKDEAIPPSCTNTETGFPYENGCLQTVVDYIKSKAGILGGTAVAVLILQIAALILTCCVACGIKNAASNAIF